MVWLNRLDLGRNMFWYICFDFSQCCYILNRLYIQTVQLGKMNVTKMYCFKCIHMKWASSLHVETFSDGDSDEMYNVHFFSIFEQGKYSGDMIHLLVLN